jgi:FkbM family methyltransferase
MVVYNKLRNLVKRIFHKIPDKTLYTYSQCGEDRILQYLFKQLNVSMPSYIDIGAHHPTILSNTQLFYTNGSRGINIEPDPDLIDSFYKERPLDVNLNVGIGLRTDPETADFYVMSSRVLNTFSKQEAERVESFGTYKIEAAIKVQLMPLQNIVNTYFTPNLISLDIEGLDLAVLRSIDLAKYQHTVFCVETINYAEDGSEKKNIEIFKYFEDNGFFVYADTYINTIFVNRAYWLNRKTTA